MEWIEDQMGYFKSGEEPFVRNGGSAGKGMHFYLLSSPAIQLLTFPTPRHSTPLIYDTFNPMVAYLFVPRH
jgi:hypothetical protein